MAREEKAGQIMRFWHSFFGKTVKIGDAFFGEMVVVEIADDPARNYFECARYFRPSREVIELSVAGSPSGPTQQQKDFFTQLENDYPLLVDIVTPVIEERFGAWMEQPVIQDFEKEFKPTYLSLPTCDRQPVAWEIAFDTVHDVNHTVTIGMLGYEPQYVRVDG